MLLKVIHIPDDVRIKMRDLKNGDVAMIDDITSAYCNCVVVRDAFGHFNVVGCGNSYPPEADFKVRVLPRGTKFEIV